MSLSNIPIALPKNDALNNVNNWYFYIIRCIESKKNIHSKPVIEETIHRLVFFLLLKHNNCICLFSSFHTHFILKLTFQFSARVDRDALRCGAGFRSTFFHFAHHIGAADHMTEYNVLAIQPICPANLDWKRKQSVGIPIQWISSEDRVLLRGGDEELWTVAVWSGIGHGKCTEILVF